LTHTDAVMTGEVVSLRAHDGHVLSAYQARPDKPPRGGLVLLQEIFGVTGHIRRVCDGYAAQGYHVVAPALFDRVRPGIELGYSKEMGPSAATCAASCRGTRYSPMSSPQKHN